MRMPRKYCIRKTRIGDINFENLRKYLSDITYGQKQLTRAKVGPHIISEAYNILTFKSSMSCTYQFPFRNLCIVSLISYHNREFLSVDHALLKEFQNYKTQNLFKPLLFYEGYEQTSYCIRFHGNGNVILDRKR